MRFGWLAALAAMVVAVPASAATWVTYLANGTGYSRVTNSIGGDIQPPVAIDFTLTFSLPAGESVFNPIYPYNLYSFNGATSGSLSFTFLATAPGAFISENATINYDDTDSVGGFPAALASNMASGSFSYRAGDYYANQFSNISGTITGLVILDEGGPFDGVHFVSAPVPEPGTWAMMLIGFGAIGRMLRRRAGLGQAASPAAQPA